MLKKIYVMKQKRFTLELDFFIKTFSYKTLQACFISVTFIIRLNVLEKFINFLGHCNSNFR